MALLTLPARSNSQASAPAAGVTSVPIFVINLDARVDRWRTTQRQFTALGLQPRRHAAIWGPGLTREATRSLYCERLNRQQYYRPLQPGEIGCYASHLALWRALVASEFDLIAVFEDDVDIDPDLPRLLDAVAARASEFDIVKLIGRERETTRARVPLPGGRDLVSYRRVPSLTGAYVITRAAAAKLIDGRRRIGRPVDVDMRYWWELDLVVRGVYPYPTRQAPASRASSIGGRQGCAGSTGRLKKLALQAHYTATNAWHAWHDARTAGPVEDRAAGRLPGPPPATGPLWPRGVPMPPPPDGARAAPDTQVVRPLVRKPVARRRNLVVLRAGDASLHREWLAAPHRDFDLFISYYGSTPQRWRNDGEYYEMRPGPKWPCIAELLQRHPNLVDEYESFWFPDDDLSVDTATIDRLFAFVCAYGLCLAQPALSRDSFYTWNTLLQDPQSHLRYTRFVEVMAPLFNRQALRTCITTFSQSPSGWGLDWVWPTLCEQAALGRMAIVDATPVKHTRPVGGDLYRNHPEMNPREDARRLLRAYGIEEVRAVAKYSFEGHVRDVPLSLRERFVFWLKRLNGRRKHRPQARHKA